MDEKTLIEWAVKGIHAEIAKLEKDINTGKQLLLQYERREKPKTTKTPDEIRDIISEKRVEINKLDRQRFDLTWRVVEIEEEEKKKGGV